MPKILVVDDDRDFVRLLKARLENSGYETLVAYDGQEALDKTREGNPDLILLDLVLPKMDGFRVCETLKKDEQYKKIPIIMLTGRTEELERIVAQDMCVDAYLRKPFDDAMLLAKIKELLGH